VLARKAFSLRFFTDDHQDDRLLLVNLGGDVCRTGFADPLLAPPLDRDWEVRWSSEHARYGGGGTPALWPGGSWNIPGESAIVLRPSERRQPRPPGKRRRTA
jgi:maltooligosyltrehalose trehalohydrolase